MARLSPELCDECTVLRQQVTDAVVIVAGQQAAAGHAGIQSEHVVGFGAPSAGGMALMMIDYPSLVIKLNDDCKLCVSLVYGRGDNKPHVLEEFARLSSN